MDPQSNDIDKPKINSKVYQKHGRDTPEGRAKYENSRKRIKNIVTYTAEGSKWTVHKTVNNRYRQNIEWATRKDSDGQVQIDTVQRCQQCNKWTSRCDYCDVCRQQQL